MDNNELMRTIPSIEKLMARAADISEFGSLSHGVLVNFLRNATQFVRNELMTEPSAAELEKTDELITRIISRALQERDSLLQPNLRKVINATGIVLHTNLGRAPLSESARRNVNMVMEGYCTLEYDLATGKRGDRQQHLSQRIAQATGAEASMVVNNNAAAVILILAAFARGREVIVSRGELVEIGGSFRIPDVMKQSGAVLVEVGTTNKTHLEDYAAAISEKTAAILKVHTSNYRIVGFSSEPAVEELCGLAHRNGILALNDLGSGTLKAFSSGGYREPSVDECINAGFDLVTFSGDKLLGASQAGIIAGKSRFIELLRNEPLLRAFRIDKLSLAALEGTLLDYACGLAEKSIPTWEMLNMSLSELSNRAKSLVTKLEPLIKAGWKIGVVPTKSLSGGGSLPAVEIPGFGIEITPCGISATQAEENLRKGDVAIVGLLRENALVFDVRCLLKGDEEVLCQRLLGLLQEAGR